jgi:molecular chaperone DnaK
MNNKFKNTIGIDFGTTNSFINRCPIDKLISTQIILNSRETGIETAILYSNDGKIIIGNDASETWGNASEKERKNYTLRLRFKPEIDSSVEAKKYAIDFLTAIRNLTEIKFANIVDETTKILLGVPSEADTVFKSRLKEIADSSGFKNTQLIDEPIGALLFFLARNDISPSEATKGVLIIDFGGGTCDFAWMQDLEIISSWGDMLLGGCLFDDLFYQWWLEKNPTAINHIKNTDAEFFFHWYVCKKIKESFSEFMLINKNEKWSYSFREYGALKDISWTEFIERTVSYKPSKTFINYLKENKLEYDKLANQKINLLKWFEDTLKTGIEKNLSNGKRINKVILAGGSSLWLFVADIVKKVLNLDDKDILKCENPYAVISQGLSLYPALVNIHSNVQKKLQNNLDNFITSEIKEKIIKENVDKLLDKIIKKISAELIDDRIKNLLKNYRRNGGSFNNLEIRIKDEIKDFQTDIRNLIENDLIEHSKFVAYKINKRVREWFEENNIKLVDELKSTEKKYENAIDLNLKSHSAYETEETLLVLFFTLIIANLSGGGGIALIVAGLPGLIIGGIIGLAASIYGMNQTKKYFKEIEIPSFVLRFLLTDGKINKILRKIKSNFHKELHDNIMQQLNELSNDFIQKIKVIIQKEINSISAIASFLS